ncbi:MAG: GNAT family N-acetyltransferase [Clostridiales bacterium]|nr:GNAT family N-acetyltransferase [Clostridiales bacterium]
MIKGNKVELIPATLNDKQKVYEWCFCSEITKSHAGPPDYPEAPVATGEEFFSGYEDYYFTGSRPKDGRGFIIHSKAGPVGFISYASFHLQPHKSELDIWMDSESNCGKGYGPDAIVALGEYLRKEIGINELIMRPSVKNTRAIRAYNKAGFVKTGRSPKDFLLSEYMPVYGDGDYGPNGDVLLVKEFNR